MEKFCFLESELRELEKAGLLRGLVCGESVHGTIMRVGGEDKVVFCSNNYLNLSGDGRIVRAVCEAVGEYGYGAGASRLISGTMGFHVEVERAFAEFFGKEASLLFSSGWSANEAVLKTVPQKGDLVLLDKLDHASIIDAVKSGGAKFRTFRRDNLSKLEQLLADDSYERKFIVTESVFSMDGDMADLKRLVELKKTYNAILIVDEAHAVGCVGETGTGLGEELDLLDKVDIIVAPMGKAMGAAGAIVAGSKTVIDYLINRARAFIYTTAPPVANCAALLAALKIVKSERQRRKKLVANSEYLRSKLKELGFDTGNSKTWIIPVIIGDAKETLRVSKELFERGIFLAAIRPPTVAVGSSRLRISVQSDHTRKQLDMLIGELGSLILRS